MTQPSSLRSPSTPFVPGAVAPAVPAPRERAVTPLVAALALVALVAHVVTNVVSPYGVHRDELLYLAMGRHLQLWRMDFPPMIALVATGTGALLGDSLVALRMVPALAHAAMVVLAAAAARLLGGSRAAQGIAALVTLLGVLFLRAGNLFQPVVLDQLLWTVVYLLLLVIARDGHADGERFDADAVPRGRWIVLGVVAGLALLTKFSALIFGAAVAGALLATPLRRALGRRGPWIALAIAFVLGAPSFVGQVRLHFPVMGQMRDLQAGQLARVTPAAFLTEQLLFGPGTLLALGGLAALLAARWARPYRVLGVACLTTTALLMALHGKAYYLGPIYPVLYGAGAVAIERLTRPRLALALRALTIAAMVAFGAATLPLGLPLLAPEPMARYAARLGVTQATRTNRGEVLPLPQDYADMLPWEEEATAVARAYHALPPAEKVDAVILAENYGEAGALDYYGPRLGLPPAVLPSSSYWYFGPGPKPGKVLVTIGVDSTDLAPFYESVTVVGRTPRNVYYVDEEQELPILVGRGPRSTLQAIWPGFEGRN